MTALQFRVTGADEVERQLRLMPARLRGRATEQALAKSAVVVRQAARDAAPKLSPTAPAVLLGRRKPGVLKRAISVRKSKRDKLAGNVGVFVNVRPAAGAKFKKVTKKSLGGLVIRKQRVQVKASKRSTPNDPFYWRWVEFGHKIVPRQGKATGSLRRRRASAKRSVPGVKFLRGSASALPRVLSTFSNEFKAVAAKLNTRKG